MSEQFNQGQSAEQETGSKTDKKQQKKEKKEQKRLNRKKNNKGGKGVVIAAVVLLGVIVAALAGQNMMRRSRTASADSAAHNTTTVTRGAVVSELSSSGVISPKDTYDITSLVEGEVVAADFEEGDQVEAGQVLYQIDVSSMESEIRSAGNSLERAQNSYNQALTDYNEALADYSGNTYKSTRSGFISELKIQAGDRVGSNTELASIYNDTTMKIKVPFLSGEAAMLAVGSEGVITLTDTEEQLAGRVTAISNMDEVLAGGRMVRYVTLEVANPGGLTTSHTAAVTIGELVSAQEGTFEPMTDTVMNADISSSVEVEALLVNEGDYVEVGTPIFRMSSRDAENILRTYKDTLDTAQERVETAQSNVDNTQDTYENYTITAPISGQVITKTSKTGDNISRSTGSSTTMAVIYDLSQVTFEMSVDELDVRSVQVGQSVEVTADAVEGKTFTGIVTNVSLQSAQSNGVTNYPVTVTLDEVGELLPGMNVDGRIILDQVEDTLIIPVDSLMRGNRVYIKDSTQTEAQGSVPAGFRAVEVETGLINDDYVEILSGLSEGDEIYVAESTNDTSFMMPGMGMQGGMSIQAAPAGGGGGARQGGPR